MMNRLSSKTAMKSVHGVFGSLIRDEIYSTIGRANRFYYTNRHGKVTLYSKISPLGDPGTRVTPELNRWIDGGNKVRVAELQRIIQDLRKRKRFSQALEVSMWMKRRGLCEFTSTEHAIEIDLVGRVHGFLSAESYFNGLCDEDKTVKTYGALLNCYVRERKTEESLSHLQKMKELGFASSPLTYNDIMCLYTNIGQHEKIPDVLSEMKKNNVSPDNFSYRICISSYGVRSDIEGMEKILKEMESQPHIVMDWNTYSVVASYYIKADLIDKAVDSLRKSEQKLENKDGLGYNHLITLYASLGNKAEVLRLWGLEKIACKRCINRDYITMLESLVKLGEFVEAEKLLKEWEESGNCYDFKVPNIVITAHCKKGNFEDAEAILEELLEKGRVSTPKSWGLVAEGYLENGEMEKAQNCMRVALGLSLESKGWKPNPKVYSAILSWLGERGELDNVEAFVASLKTVIPVNRQMYHALLRVNIRSGKAVDGILSSMKADKVSEDDETKKILSQLQTESQV